MQTHIHATSNNDIIQISHEKLDFQNTYMSSAHQKHELHEKVLACKKPNITSSRETIFRNLTSSTTFFA